MVTKFWESRFAEKLPNLIYNLHDLNVSEFLFFILLLNCFSIRFLYNLFSENLIFRKNMDKRPLSRTASAGTPISQEVRLMVSI